MTRMRRTSTIAGGALLLALALPAAGQGAGKPSYGCSAGFELGSLTFEQAADLPRSRAAVDAGLVDRATLIVTYAGFDANGNGLICGKLQPGFTHAAKPFAAYLYNFTDDNSSSG